jgi:hypothetical protein
VSGEEVNEMAKYWNDKEVYVVYLTAYGVRENDLSFADKAKAEAFAQRMNAQNTMAATVGAYRVLRLAFQG